LEKPHLGALAPSHLLLLPSRAREPSCRLKTSPNRAPYSPFVILNQQLNWPQLGTAVLQQILVSRCRAIVDLSTSALVISPGNLALSRSAGSPNGRGLTNKKSARINRTGGSGTSLHF
jgi:hypothetical protein